mgnify:FL=1
MIKEQFEEQKYLQLKDFLNEDEKNKLTQVIEELENHKFCNKTTSVNNHYVENTGRRQAILFSENFNTQDVNLVEEIRDWFKISVDKLFPIVLPKVDSVFRELGYDNLRLLRTTIHYIPPEEQAQSIHHDGDALEKTFFVSIPLHDTNPEQGTTELYNDKYVGHIRDNYGIYSWSKLKIMWSDTKTKELLKKAKNNNVYNYGDAILYRDITFHRGGTNNSNIVRKFLHFFLTYSDTKWVDYYDFTNTGGLKMVRSDSYFGDRSKISSGYN